MPRRMEMQMKPYTIDGHEGILATIDRGKENPLYIVAYSPDLEAGSGTVVCIVGSSFPWETTQSIIDFIEAQVVWMLAFRKIVRLIRCRIKRFIGGLT
jgi:hypothetical protein